MPPDAAPLLELEGLSIGFGGGVDLVADVSFAIAPGETLCLVGEFGCGKSITALALMGLLPSPPADVRAAAIRFEGQDLLRLGERAPARTCAATGWR